MMIATLGVRDGEHRLVAHGASVEKMAILAHRHAEAFLAEVFGGRPVKVEIE